MLGNIQYSTKMIPTIFFFIAIASFCNGDDYIINNKPFPDDFMFGVATASYQVEGGWNADGKGQNIWDNFTHTYPERIWDGSNGDVAGDSYHKYATDVELLKQLGVTHYRFSISWTRILPNGFADYVNDAGIQHYKDLIQLLKENDIVPLVTIYHWDLPQALQDHGGFLNRSFADWYTDYARICFEQFGNDVKLWLTFNEGSEICVKGYGTGHNAPAIALPAQGDYLCAHNLLRAHANAWHMYDSEFRHKQGGLVSLTHATSWFGPLTDSDEDKEASETQMQFNLGWWANPVWFGDYPEIMKIRIANRSKLEGFTESRLPEFTEEEKAWINNTADYFAFNTYLSYWAKAIPEPDTDLPPSIEKDAGVEIIGNSTDDGQADGSWGMALLINWIQTHYNNPRIIITENGLANGGEMNDTDRIERVQNYLSRIRDAIDDGAQVFGYTMWSLIDTFEWTMGYMAKFGIYQVDFESENKTRTPKASAHWYNNVIMTRCLVDNCQ